MLNKDELISQRGDLSPFLIHLTRAGVWTDYTDIEARIGERRTLDAKESLISILRDGRINARSPYGYFNYKVRLERNGQVLNNHSAVKRDWLRCVCFTETPVDHVHLQTQSVLGRSLHFRPYGLALWESAVRRSSGNPIFYFDTSNRQLRAGLDAIATSPTCVHLKSLLPLYEGFGPRAFGSSTEVDFRWEREWRVVGNFDFQRSDIAFGLCRFSDIQEFERETDGAIPFVDPTGNLDEAKAKLRLWPRLVDIR